MHFMKMSHDALRYNPHLAMEDHDIKIDDDDMKVEGRSAGSGIDEAGKKWISIRAMRQSMEVCILASL